VKIVFDIDNTLFHNDVVEKISQKYNTTRAVKHDLSDLPEHVKNECFEAFSNVDTMCSLKPFTGLVGLDKWLVEQDHELYCVTARNEETMKEKTLEMLNVFPHIPKDNIYFGKEKKHIYRQIRPDIVIDDHIGHIVEAIGCGVKHIVLISNNLTPYNHYSCEDMRQHGVIVVDSVETFFKHGFGKLENK